MNHPIGPAAEAARENARTAEGRFGEQPHADAGQLGLDGGELSGWSETDVDATLAELGAQRNLLFDARARLFHRTHQVVGDRMDYSRRVALWGFTDAEALERLRRQAAEAVDEADRVKAQQVVDEFSACDAAFAANDAEQQPLRDEYVRRGGWNRFFHVTNPGGHIHSSTDCPTCKHSTRFVWRTDLSGRSEADAVAEHGAILCTVCFPSAPVEWTNLYEQQQQAKSAGSCPGSKQMFDASLPNRARHAYGRTATCHVCGQEVALTAANRLRSHKPG